MLAEDGLATVSRRRRGGQSWLISYRMNPVRIGLRLNCRRF